MYGNEHVATLYPTTGQIAEQPSRLVLMSVMYSMENDTDRQAAAAMKTQIDLKDAFSLELTDLGFDFSLLREFRTPCIQGRK